MPVNNHPNKNQQQFQVFGAGIQRIRTSLFSDIIERDALILKVLKSNGARPETIRGFERQFEEDRAMQSGIGKDRAWMDSAALNFALGKDLVSYAASLWKLNSFIPDFERGKQGTYADIKNVCNRIVDATLEYVDKTTAMLHSIGLEDALDGFGEWLGGARKARLGFERTSDSLGKAFAAVDDKAAWVASGGYLVGKMAGILREAMTTHVLALTAYSYASAGGYNEAIKALGVLVAEQHARATEHITSDAARLSSQLSKNAEWN